MNWFGSGFIPILCYMTTAGGALEAGIILTESSDDILTESANALLIES